MSASEAPSDPQSTAHAQPGSAPSPAALASWIPLALLLLALPLLRERSSWLSGTQGEAQLVWLLELLYVALALLDRRLRLPSLASWPPSVRGALWLWLALSTLAVFASEHAAAAAVRHGQWLSHGLFAVVLWGQLRALPRLARGIACAIPAGLAIYTFALARFAFELDDPATFDWAWQLPGFDNVRHLGYYSATVTAFLAAWLVPRPRRWPRSPLVAAALTGSWTLLFWTGSRGAVVAVAGSLVALWVLRVAPGWGRALVGVGLTSAIGAWLSTFLRAEQHSLGLGHVVGTTLEHATAAADLSTKLDRMSGARLSMWSLALSELGEAPWLGLGPDGFSFVEAAGIHLQPHSLVLQALLDWGVVAAACFAVVGGFIAVEALRRTRTPSGAAPQPLRLGALAALVAALVYSLLDANLYNGFPSMLSACLLALALQPAAGEEPGNRIPAAPAPTPRRRIAAALAALPLALLFALHSSVMIALARQEPPPPDGAGPRLVQAFPSRVEGVAGGASVLDWAIAWSAEDPDLAIAWLHRGHAHARRSWPYHQLEARLLWQRGDEAEARRHLEEAAREAATFEQKLKTRAMQRIAKGA